VFGRVYISKTLDAVDCAIAETLCKPRHHHTTAFDIQHGTLGVWANTSPYILFTVLPCKLVTRNIILTHSLSVGKGGVLGIL